MNNHRGVSVVFALVLALALSSCAAVDAPQPIRRAWASLPFTAPMPTPTPPYRTVVVALPDEGPQTDQLRSILTAYDRDRAEVRVQVQMLDPGAKPLHEALTGPSPPDVAVVDAFQFPDLAAAGLLAPANGRLPGEQDYYPQLVRAFTWEGSQYCLPREVRTLALVYDLGKFEQAGITPPTTWDELGQAAEALTDLNTGSFGFIEVPDLSRWLPFLYQAGGQIIDEQGRVVLDGPPARAALDFYVQVYRDNFAGHPGESNSTWAGEVLGKGEGGMAVEGNWVAPYFAAEFPDFRYGVAPLPAGPAGRGTVAFTSCFAVAARSQNLDAAFALVTHLASPEVQALWPEDGSVMPPRPRLMDAWKEAFPHLAAFADAVDEARVWQFPPGFEAFLHSFNRGMAELLAANIEAEDLLAEMQRVAEDVLERK